MTIAQFYSVGGVYLKDGVQTSGERFLAGVLLKGRQPNDLTVPEL